MKYETVIGMEVHVELQTASKMFCRCSADYAAAESNTHVCPVCLGMPGVLPVLNAAAVAKAVRFGAGPLRGAVARNRRITSAGFARRGRRLGRGGRRGVSQRPC